MKRDWTFTQKIAAGFVVVLVLTLITGVIAIASLRSVVAAKDDVLGGHAQNLIDAQKLHVAFERHRSASRGFLLGREARFLEQMREARREAAQMFERLERNVRSDEERRQLRTIAALEPDYYQALDRVTTRATSNVPAEEVAKDWEQQVLPKREALGREMDAFIALEEHLAADAKRISTESASAAIWMVSGIVAGAVLLAAIIALLLSRSLGEQIARAISHVQASSTELQAAASQQATGAREQVTAMSEIATTINELLASARQIAQGAQRVARTAEDTAASARTGGATVARTDEVLNGIRKQVDQVVTHMLELGRKSQQIGSVVDIVSELAEQTNILAINASIEAAGAGESGRRFAIVADEIRKLADRVAGSAKEIRVLIDDVRGAVNTTVMATETSSKSVDAGARQFAEVAASFNQIAAMVVTASESAREIELSTKQQTTAVEQVNLAISNVAQSTRESEASTGQTLQTASQLAGLSHDLMRLIRPQASA
jgi:CHASE3 domain sensor protein